MPRGLTEHTRGPIAILTDFGADSFYVGAAKGAAIGVHPHTEIVDITHGIRAHDVLEGSFVLGLVYEVFPVGTVFLCVVDPGVGGPRNNMVFDIADRYVVAPDNGLVSDVAERLGVDGAFVIKEEAVRKLRTHRAEGRTFLGRDIFAPAAAALARGVAVGDLAVTTRKFKQLELPVVGVKPGVVTGGVRYVDSFGNILTNITGAHIEGAFGVHPFAQLAVTIDGATEIRGIREYFAERSTGELFAVLNSWGLLELSVNRGRAEDHFEHPHRLAISLTKP